MFQNETPSTLSKDILNIGIQDLQSRFFGRTNYRKLMVRERHPERREGTLQLLPVVWCFRKATKHFDLKLCQSKKTLTKCSPKFSTDCAGKDFVKVQDFDKVFFTV